LHDGVLANSARSAVKVNPTPLPGEPAPRFSAPSSRTLSVSFRPDGRLADGRFANNGWLQELPDPFTKLTWDNAALVHPDTAAGIGVRSGDVVRVSVEGRSIEIPAMVIPGVALDTVVLPFGNGRATGGRVAAGHGTNVYPLRGASYFVPDATVTKTGRRAALATTQDHGTMHGRDLVRVHSTGHLAEAKHGHHSHHGRVPLDLATPATLDGAYQWGMVIDLNACTGCSACIVACQSENNTPIVGREEVLRGRIMHWIRADRYFVGEPAAPDLVVTQPVMCQHCESAPCEPVCPVNASVHSPEGLNLQVYNRCVGTRYCSNNCPYKARRFNWFDYHHKSGASQRLGPLASRENQDLAAMQKNPDVTVRMRGVMEKCTYCVQRIERGRIGAKLAGGTIADGSVVPACVQACPAGAMVFGNIADPTSRVARLKKSEHDYRLLEEVNTKPRTSYLARRRNPNPQLMGGQG
jgi:molybdopterin-containing oxidoreductase family iron-sulfur binding subunit